MGHVVITYLRVKKNLESAEEDGDSLIPVAGADLPGILTCCGLIFVGKEYTTKSTKIYTPRKFLRVRYIIHLYSTQEDVTVLTN